MPYIPQTIPSLFFHACSQYPDNIAFKSKINFKWQTMTYFEAEKVTIAIAKCLLHNQIQKGDKVAIFANNCARWVMADIAIQSIGAITVPIYATLHPKEARYILEHAEVKMLFGDDDAKLSEIQQHLPNLDLIHLEESSNVTPWDQFLKNASLISNKDFFLQLKTLSPLDLASIVYTSGTTGTPKGVMLSQGNITSNVVASLQVIHIGAEDSSVSFLPLSHMFERVAGCFCILFKGASMAFCPDVTKVPEYILDIKPTILVTVPRLLEKIYQKIWDQINRKPKLIRMLFHRAIYKTTSKNLSYSFFDKLFFKKIRGRLGGRIRFIVSGGAALPNDIYHFLDQCGLCILQGYGLTETSPVACVNPPEKRKIGTVGPPIVDVEVKIAFDGEIWIKGPNIMQGYFKNIDETQKVMTEDGFFKSGDIGQIDMDGYLSITDRIKDLIVTSGGKKIAPLPIENQLASSRWIEQVCLVGEGQKTIGALIVPNFDLGFRYFSSSLMEQSTEKDLAALPALREMIQKSIDQVNENLSQYEKIKSFHVLEKPFSLENQELTPTLKLRRVIINQHYAPLIEQMFLSPEA